MNAGVEREVGLLQNFSWLIFVAYLTNEENGSNLNILGRARACLCFPERGQDGHKEGRAGILSALKF